MIREEEKANTKNSNYDNVFQFFLKYQQAKNNTSSLSVSK
jgi:hypothetical protein